MISRDKEFKRRMDVARRSARGEVKETRVDIGHTSQDFDLRSVRDAPVSKDNTGGRRQNMLADAAAVETAAENFTASDIIGAANLEDDSLYNNEASAPVWDDYGKTKAPFREVSVRADRQRQVKSRHTRNQHSSRYQQQFQEKHQPEKMAENENETGIEIGNNSETGKNAEVKTKENTASNSGKQSEPKPKESAGRSKTESAKSSKLKFSPEELPKEKADKKLNKAVQKSTRMETKLEQANERLPTKRKLRMETVSDPETGKATKHLKFEKEIKSQRTHMKGALPLRPVKAGVNTLTGYAHKKVYQAEDENVGVKAAHRTELAGEAGVRAVWHRHKRAPYRRVEKLQNKTVRAKANAAYRQALQENPKLKKKLSARLWQKQKLKRQYAKAAREAQKSGKRIKSTMAVTEKIGSGIVHVVKSHPFICAVVVLLFLLFFLITSVVSSFANLGSGALGSIFASTYLAEDQDIDKAELQYTQWETDLQIEINHVENDRPGYDEYRYQIDAIEHDPYVLMGYLTSVYQNFTYVQVEGILQELFDAQYNLTYEEETEIRYRTETYTDPETGMETEVEVPYEWQILNVRLKVIPLDSIILSRMESSQKEICEILLTTKGNRQYVGNVFGTNWLPFVTSLYGYRIHPVSEEKEYHTGVDIGMPEGTDILAGHDGRVTFTGDIGNYGLCVVLEGEALEGHSLVTKYGHCSQILVSAGQEVKAGDIIARVGSTGNSTGSHLHFEVMVDGQYLNPLYFADTGDTEGSRLPSGASGENDYLDYDIPPDVLTDDKFAAMLAEAEKYLGYPYVWGGSSPSTSFDCSGYVSWVINHSGWDVGRQSANGLLSVCTPVSSADARPGDLIFFKGTYNTSGASHVGIYVGDGMMIHCGSPISYANINSTYWKSHYYTHGRLP